jgi:hypothetical protein
MRKIGLIFGAFILVAGTAIAAASYDPKVELFPGRLEPLSKVQRTVAVWDTPVAGREPNWVNPDPPLPTYPNPIFSSDRTGRYH